MRNEFPGKCARCNVPVGAYEGYFERANGDNKELRKLRGIKGKWLLRCQKCVGKGHVPPRTLRIIAPHYCAGAVFEKIVGVWNCTEAAPIVKWMEYKPVSEIKSYLDKKGYTYHWLKP